MSSPLSAQGQRYKNFLITTSSPIPELCCTYTELLHEPSQAKIIHIGNEDPENLFCLSFQTFPPSSNGVAHILEHTVLCGSQKFPVKDPFFSMTRRSMNTYMNALTGQDFTCYPASSLVEKDFYNLLEVYLDSVFFPKLTKESFLQEGHRLQVTPEGRLQFQGIVYNEMKGAMSSRESRLWQALSRALLPELPYRFNSGGDPREIPSLTYEELQEFHKIFYHPSRCLFFFYGNLPLSKHLDFLENQLLQQAPAPLPPLSPLPLQTRFQNPVFVEASFPLSKDEPPEKQTQIAFSWLTCPTQEPLTLLSLALLDSILTDTDASPLKKSLLASGLCSQVSSSIDGEMSEAPWTFVCSGCEAKDAEALRKTLFEALETASTSFTQEQIEASLHQLEFERTEIDSEGGPFGLHLFFRTALAKQHGGDGIQGLLIHSLFFSLREHLKNPQYLPCLLKTYLLDNPHFVQLILKPDRDLESQEIKEECQRLLEIEKRLSPEEKTALVEQNRHLEAYQESLESQSLECLPKLHLTDVPQEAQKFSLSQKIYDSFSLFHHDCFTNQILYADLIWDLPHIPLHQVPWFAVFTHLLTEIGSGGRTYEETLDYQQSYLGEFSARLSLFPLQEDPQTFRPALCLRGKSLYRHSEQLLSLFQQTCQSADFSDKKRIQEWLSQHLTDLKQAFPHQALSYATRKALRSLSIPSLFYDQYSGLPYYENLLQWAGSGEPLEIDLLSSFYTSLMSQGKPSLVLTCEATHLAHLEKNVLTNWNPRLAATPSFLPWQGDYSLPNSSSELHPIAAPVAFTASATRTLPGFDPRSAQLSIAAELMKDLILHKEIREKGGAYGSGATYMPALGSFYFHSYRDPHLFQTTQAFTKALQNIAQGRFNLEQLEEAKLGVLQGLDHPVAIGNRGFVAYSWERSHRSFAIRQAFREALFSSTKEDVARTVQEHLLAADWNLFSLLGRELAEKENTKFPHPFPITSIRHGFAEQPST